MNTLMRGKWKKLGLVLIITLACLWTMNQFFPLNLPGAAGHQHYARIVVDESGRPLRAFADSNGVWRYQVALDEVSPLYIEALLNYEDRWFWSHPGINPIALLRAAYLNISNGRIVSGGSTISMQVARLLHPHSRTMGGKLKQMLRTLQLEWHLSKEQILTLYLNIAPFGGTLEGVQAASFTYLNKPSIELTHAEAALLTVLPQAPTRYRPDLHPKAAQKARDKVLARL
ncbi:MAG: transglycosylase domain-containing protein, partial [Psychrosphaera sp.]|nr:transglycosylase domain-containing protein [Psychrosphaera sp.]